MQIMFKLVSDLLFFRLNKPNLILISIKTTHNKQNMSVLNPADTLLTVKTDREN